MSVNGNEEPTGEICHQYSSVVTAIIPSLHNKTPVHSTWRLLRVRAACPTPRLNQSYELRPSWEHHLRYVPHRVRNGYNSFVLSFAVQKCKVNNVQEFVGDCCCIGV